MGLGRREFIKLLGIALAGAAVDPLKAVALNNNYYANKKFGLILEKPDTWEFISYKDFGKLKSVQLLSEEYEERKEETWEVLTDPILIIAKYSLADDRYKYKLSPAINIWIHHKSGFESCFRDIAEQSFAGIQEVFKDFEVLQDITPASFSNCEAYETKSRFLYVNTEYNKSVTCEMWSFLVDHGDHFYGFNMIDSIEAKENEKKTFEQFIKTIKLS